MFIAGLRQRYRLVPMLTINVSERIGLRVLVLPERVEVLPWRDIAERTAARPGVWIEPGGARFRGVVGRRWGAPFPGSPRGDGDAEVLGGDYGGGEGGSHGGGGVGVVDEFEGEGVGEVGPGF